MIRRLLNLFRRTPPQRQPGQLLQVGGRMLDSNDWSPEVIEEIKKAYLMPSLKNAFMMRIDLAAGCPEGHTTSDRVGIFCERGDMVRKLNDHMLRMHMLVPCRSCGKQARVTGRHVAWQGDIGTWDGAI